MSDSKFDPLDTALAALPRDIPLESDLWPAIRAELAVNSRASKHRPLLSNLGQLAAGVVLAIASSVTTYVLTRPSSATHAVITETVSSSVSPISFDDNQLGPRYTKARADLESVFTQRIASLPPATRAKLLNNLSDLHRAADDITTTLAQHPADPLLQELLLSTHQRELQLLTDVGQLSIPNLQKPQKRTQT